LINYRLIESRFTSLNWTHGAACRYIPPATRSATLGLYPQLIHELLFTVPTHGGVVRLDPSDWLHTKRIYQSTDGHPSKY